MGSENIDRHSILPEEIVTQILSLLPMKLAVQTSILSKTWRHNWMFIRSLHFDDTGDKHTLIKFVDRALKYCKTSQLILFQLNLSERMYSKSTVSNWIDEAVKLNVRELDIDVFIFQLPLSLLTCKTLIKLRLCNFYDQLPWESPCPINLPCLQNLDIIVHCHPFANVSKLINGCPMIENLYLEIRCRFDEEDDCIISVPTLKRLKLKLVCTSNVSKVVLRVPNLEYLFVGGVLRAKFLMEDVSSLVEASVSFREIKHDRLWDALLKGISGVKSFSIKKIPPHLLIPIFPNVEFLELKSFCFPEQVVQFLQNCPKLKHLHVKEFAGSHWIEPKLIPTCMLTNLTTIKFTICKSVKGEIKFLEYMLENAEVLKTVSIIWDNCTIEKQGRLSVWCLKLTRACNRYCLRWLYVNLILTYLVFWKTNVTFEV